MSLYYALKALDVSAVHYSRHFNATTGREITSYAQGGGPVPLLKPLFQDSQPAPPVDLAAVRKLDLRGRELRFTADVSGVPCSSCSTSTSHASPSGAPPKIALKMDFSGFGK